MNAQWVEAACIDPAILPRIGRTYIVDEGGVDGSLELIENNVYNSHDLGSRREICLTFVL